MSNSLENNCEIIDNNGTIHSGTYEEMRKIYYIMTTDPAEIWNGYLAERMNTDDIESLISEYQDVWSGDLRLIKVLRCYR